MNETPPIEKQNQSLLAKLVFESWTPPGPVRSGPPQSTSRPGSHLHIVLVTVGQDAGGELGTVDVGLDPRVLLAWNEGRAL